MSIVCTDISPLRTILSTKYFFVEIDTAIAYVIMIGSNHVMEYKNIP